MITLEACKKVKITGNRLNGAVLGKNVKLVATSPTELELDEKQGIRVEENR
jgi:hypothetical protein